MEFMGIFIVYLVILLGFFFFFFSKINIWYFRPWEWPLVKLIPTAYFKTHQIRQKLTQVLCENKGNILLKTSFLTRVDLFITSDPVNVNYILNSKFSVYQRSSEFRRSFDFLGDSVYIKDLDEWKEGKKHIHGFYKDSEFQECAPTVIRHVIEKGLVPVLDRASEEGGAMDLQDLSSRFMLDTTGILASGSDLGSVRVGFPKCELLEAMDDMGEAVFWRYVLPESVWRVQRWMGIGKEKKMREACKVFAKTLDDFMARNPESDENFNVIKYYRDGDRVPQNLVDKTFISSNLMTLFFAGRDTSGSALTWFFHLMSTNPDAKTKILEELRGIAPPSSKHIFSSFEELNKMVYLHCALYETLRLYPPVPVLIREATQEDTLPSGHKVNRNTKVMICAYTMGRMPEIWGEDCNEFKPERWMSKKGEMNRVATTNFVSFGSGPWACLGKDFGIRRLKAAAATILHNFNVDIVQGQNVWPSVSALLNIENGLKAEISSRWA